MSNPVEPSKTDIITGTLEGSLSDSNVNFTVSNLNDQNNLITGNGTITGTLSQANLDFTLDAKYDGNIPIKIKGSININNLNIPGTTSVTITDKDGNKILDKPVNYKININF